MDGTNLIMTHRSNNRLEYSIVESCEQEDIKTMARKGRKIRKNN